MATGANEFPVANLGRQQASRGGAQLRANLRSPAMNKLAVKLSQFENTKPLQQNSLAPQHSAGYNAAQHRASGKQIQSFNPGGKMRQTQPGSSGPALKPVLKSAYNFHGGPVRYTG